MQEMNKDFLAQCVIKLRDKADAQMEIGNGSGLPDEASIKEASALLNKLQTEYPSNQKLRALLVVEQVTWSGIFMLALDMYDAM
jgi:hypothetical protein